MSLIFFAYSSGARALTSLGRIRLPPVGRSRIISQNLRRYLHDPGDSQSYLALTAQSLFQRRVVTYFMSFSLRPPQTLNRQSWNATLVCSDAE